MDFNRMWTDFALAAEYERFGMTRIAAAHNAAIAQREQDAKDAERYRWLRDKSRQMSHDPDMSGNHHWLFGCNISYALRGPTADAAIDAAMAEESGNG